MTSLLATLLLLSSSPEYCSGFHQGFLAAYCQGHQFCTAAPAPACPEAQGGFQEGYNRGYTDGQRIHPRHER